MAIVRKTVLVAVDFTDFAFAALEAARECVESPANLCLVHVLPELSAAAPGAIWGTLDDDKRRRVTEETIMGHVPPGYDGIRCCVVIGNPGRQIARRAKEISADLLVLASHGRTGFGRALMGSVAESIVRYAPCDVFVVHPKPDTAQK